jgi:hypothetical protein
LFIQQVTAKRAAQDRAQVNYLSLLGVSLEDEAPEEDEYLDEAEVLPGDLKDTLNQ